MASGYFYHPLMIGVVHVADPPWRRLRSLDGGCPGICDRDGMEQVTVVGIGGWALLVAVVLHAVNTVATRRSPIPIAEHAEPRNTDLTSSKQV